MNAYQTTSLRSILAWSCLLRTDCTTFFKRTMPQRSSPFTAYRILSPSPRHSSSSGPTSSLSAIASPTTLPLIAKLPNGDFVLVEVLVEEEKTPDARFLSYLCTLQGPQIRVGESWKNLLSVVGVNILGTGMQDVAMREKSAQYKRHYQVTDRLDTCDSPRMFPQIQLIQYSLGNLPAIDEIPDPSERYWMRFFSNAHSEENIPAGSPLVIAKAYDIIRPKHLPDSVKSALVAEEKLFLNREDAYMERGRAQKRAETVSLLRKGGKADQDTIGRLLRKRASSEGDTPANRNADAAPTLRRRRRREPRKPEAGGDSGGAEPAAAPEAPTSTRRRRHHLRQGAGGGGSLAV